MEKKARMEIKRELNAYAYMNHSANVMLEIAKENKEGNYHLYKASILFTAFTFEAYLNHIGERIIKFWGDIDRLSVESKYKVLCSGLEIGIDMGSRPFQTFKKVFDFRNKLAHGKTEFLTFSGEVTAEAKFEEKAPHAKWEDFCTIEDAERANDDIVKMIIELHRAAKLDDAPFVMGFTTASKSYIG